MYREITPEDQKLIDAATDVIRRNYREPKHTIGAAVLCESGEIYTGVNIESCGYGPCAEPISIGTAISNGDSVLKKIVAIYADGSIIPPCGNCRQLLLDYAPDIEVILSRNGKTIKIATIKEILPDAYSNF